MKIRTRTKLRFRQPRLETLERRDVPTFLASPYFETGELPEAMVLADFNGDGYPDVATADRGYYGDYYGTLSVLLGNGDGTFAPKTSYPASYNLGCMAAGDFDGDGDIDVVIPTAAVHGNLEIFLGNGDGTLAPPVIQPVDQSLRDIATADFNSDGRLDLVWTAYNHDLEDYSVVVALGNGDATFEPKFSVRDSTLFVDPEVAEFNGDNVLDFTVKNGAGLLKIFQGIGDGQFAIVAKYQTGTYTADVTTGDFNGDGHVDLAFVRDEPSNGPNTVNFLYNTGTGEFQNAVSFPAGPEPKSLAAADFDRDGTLDLAVGCFNCAGISVLRNHSGTFRRRVAYGMVRLPYLVEAGDLDRDGATDVVAVSRIGLVFAVRNLGNATFQAASNYTGASDAITVGDLNDDGVIDIAQGRNDKIRLQFGKNSGVFKTGPTYFAGQEISDVGIADFNSDGFMDLAASNHNSQGSVTVLYGVGEGVFSGLVAYYAGPYAAALRIGDFNRDGRPDLAVANDDTPGTVSVLIADSDGGFRPPASYAVGSKPTDLAVADFNRDGLLDIAAGGSGLTVLLGNFDGTFQTAITYPFNLAPSGLAIGDLNGDGIMDIAAANGYANISVLRGNGDGTFADPTTFEIAFGSKNGITVADFDNDGDLDLAGTAGFDLAGVGILLNRGDGSFYSGGKYATGGWSTGIASDDANHDGFADLVISSIYGTAVLLNAAESPPLPVGGGPNPAIHLIIDRRPPQLGATPSTDEPRSPEACTISAQATDSPSMTKAPTPALKILPELRAPRAPALGELKMDLVNPCMSYDG